MFAPPENYDRPTRSTEPSIGGDVQWVLGSLPLGSRVRFHNPVTGELTVAGYLMLSNTSRCSVYVTSEGDGNFIGQEPTWTVNKVKWVAGKKMVDVVSDGTLSRIYKMDGESNPHTFQRESPAVWEGVDEEVRAAIMEAEVERQKEEEGIRLLNYYCHEEAK